MEAGSEKNSKFDIGKRVARLLLAVVLAAALWLQIYKIDNIECESDDKLLVESALLVIEGYHPYFGIGYAMTPTWIWAAALNAGLISPHLANILKFTKQGRLEDVLRIIDRSRWPVFTDPNFIINRLRWVNAFAALGVILFAYLLAVRLSGSRIAGLTAASICALSPIIIEYGADFHPDQFLALNICACVYFCINEAEAKGKYQWLIAAIFLGAGVATKFNGGVFWIPLVIAIYLGGQTQPRKIIYGRILVASIVSAAVYMILNPYFLADFGHFIKRVLFALYNYYGAPAKSQRESGFIKVIVALRVGIGYAALLLAVVGLVLGLARRVRGFYVLISGIVCFGVLMGSSSMTVDRYIFVLIPLISALSGVGLTAISRSVPSRLTWMTALALFVISLPVYATSHILKTRANGDTRTLARLWIYEHVPPGSRIFLCGYYYPDLPYDRVSTDFWRKYFADILVNRTPPQYVGFFGQSKISSSANSMGNYSSFPTEFFRDEILSEERFFYKCFSYMAEMDEPPFPAYNLIVCSIMKGDPSLVNDFKRYWVIVTPKASSELPAGLAAQVKQNGKVVARFSNRGKMGPDLDIYEIDKVGP